MICSANTWNEIEQYALEKEDFLRTFLELPNGIPSHDTFNRVFSAIDSEQFETCFIQWISSLAKITQGEIIAIDGKTIRGAKVNEKSNELRSTSRFPIKNRNE